MDLIEAEDIKKRWQEYTEKLYKKDLNDPDNHNGVVTHVESDILECEIKWALGSIIKNKAKGDGIPAQQFKIPKDDSVKVLCSICQQIWKTQQWAQGWKRWFHSNPKERQCQRMFKLPHNETGMKDKKKVRTGHGTTDWFKIGKGVHQGPFPNFVILFIQLICRVHHAKFLAR